MKREYTEEDFDNDLEVIVRVIKSFLESDVDDMPVMAHLRIIGDDVDNLGLVQLPGLLDDDEQNKKNLISIGYVAQKIISQSWPDAEVRALFFASSAYAGEIGGDSLHEAVVITGRMVGSNKINFADIHVARDLKNNFKVINSEVIKARDSDNWEGTDWNLLILRGLELTDKPDWLESSMIPINLTSAKKHKSFYDNMTSDISHEKIEIPKHRLN